MGRAHRLTRFAAAVVAALLCALAAWGAAAQARDGRPAQGWSEPWPSGRSRAVAPSPRGLAEFSARAMRETWPPGQAPVGTGVFVAGDLIVTAAHVVAACTEVSVAPPGGSERRADLVAYEPEFDLALLQVPGARARFARLGGRPRGDARVTIAVVSPDGVRDIFTTRLLDQPTRIGGLDLSTLALNLQVGASGAGVTDEAGRLVGIVVASDTVTRRTAALDPRDLSRFLARERVPVARSRDSVSALDAAASVRCRGAMRWP